PGLQRRLVTFGHRANQPRAGRSRANQACPRDPQRRGRPGFQSWLKLQKLKPAVCGLSQILTAGLTQMTADQTPSLSRTRPNPHLPHAEQPELLFCATYIVCSSGRVPWERSRTPPVPKISCNHNAHKHINKLDNDTLKS